MTTTYKIHRADTIELDDDGTTAEQIARLYGDDGQCFETDDGVDISDVCAALGTPSWRDGRGTDPTRYDFLDGSALVVDGGGWDFPKGDEGDDRYRWAGATPPDPELDIAPEGDAYLKGQEAVDWAEANGIDTLWKYNDPIDHARAVTLEEAREILREDPGLIAIAPGAPARPPWGC